MSEHDAWVGRSENEAASIPRLQLALQGGELRIAIATSGMFLGRHTEADIRLALADISRRHCRFDFREGQWLVVDLNSLNGTFVNEEPVQEAPLQPGDVLRVGTFRFLVEIDNEEPVPLAERIFRLPPPGDQPRQAS
jgi:pSer/pThr/pTyr-binding forkhead associated (FHA) protein